LSGIIPLSLCNINSLAWVDFSGNHFDNKSCPAIHCIQDNGVTFTIDPDQLQQNGFSLINSCACNTPVLDYISATTDPIQLGIDIEISFFSSSGYIASAYWSWGDGTTTDVDVEGEITTSHTYTEPGVYTPTLTLVGCDEVVDTTYRYIVIYDPDGGFVTGAGWIESPIGASILYPEAAGVAHFGFVSKYVKGATVPIGRTQFKFSAGDLDYESSEYDWLVVAGSKAKFKGTGTINDEGEYGFMISAIDGDVKEKGDPDKFRIQIWNKEDESVVYDNQLDAEIDEDPTTAIGAGSIVVHDPNIKSATLTDSHDYSMGTEELKVYPNPTSAFLNIDGLNTSSHKFIKVYDFSGRCIKTINVKTEKIEVDLHSYPAGVYHVTILNNKGVTNFKIIKK